MYRRSLCVCVQSYCRVIAHLPATSLLHPFENQTPNVEHAQRANPAGTEERSHSCAHSTALPLCFGFNPLLLCQANPSLPSVEVLVKSAKYFPGTRKWDSSCARECKKKPCLCKSLVVCTNITLKYSVLNVCSINQRKMIAGFYNYQRCTSLPADLLPSPEGCIILSLTSVSGCAGTIVKKVFRNSHNLLNCVSCQTTPALLRECRNKRRFARSAAHWSSPREQGLLCSLELITALGELCLLSGNGDLELQGAIGSVSNGVRACLEFTA